MTQIDTKLIEAALRPAMPGEVSGRTVRYARRGIAKHYRELRASGLPEELAITKARQHWLECYLSVADDCELSEEHKP